MLYYSYASYTTAGFFHGSLPTDLNYLVLLLLLCTPHPEARLGRLKLIKKVSPAHVTAPLCS